MSENLADQRLFERPARWWRSGSYLLINTVYQISLSPIDVMQTCHLGEMSFNSSDRRLFFRR